MAAPSKRRLIGLSVFVVALVLGLAAILVAGTHQKRSTAFTAEVDPSAIVAALGAGQTVCQGPVRTTQSFASVTVWTQAAVTGDQLLLTVRPAHGDRTIDRGLFVRDNSLPQVGYGAAARARLRGTIPTGRRVQLCFTAHHVPADLLGGPAATDSGQLVLGGKPSGLATAAVFDSADARSVLSLVPTIVSRAALFRPGWVGRWTFWVLAGLLVLAVLGLGWTLSGLSAD